MSHNWKQELMDKLNCTHKYHSSKTKSILRLSSLNKVVIKLMDRIEKLERKLEEYESSIPHAESTMNESIKCEPLDSTIYPKK